MSIQKTVKTIARRIRNRLPLYNFNHVAQAAINAGELEKRRRGTVTQQMIESVDKIVDQPEPYGLLVKYANRHPFLRVVHGASIREIVRNRWDVVEKFAKKCLSCGQEFKEPVDECPDCGAKALLRDPNPIGKKRLEAFLENPNRDDEMVDIIKSLMKYNLAVDDWYLSVLPISDTGQLAIYVEDSAEIFICADKHGRLGNGVWFCPKCWSEDNTKTYSYKDLEGGCPHCGEALKETAYVQKMAGTIKARFGREEIIHGNSDPWLPQLYGNSKVMAVLHELRSALAMNNFNFATYSTGHLNKLIVLKGEDQHKADEIAKAAQEQNAKVTIDSWTGQIRREGAGSLWIGARDGAEVHDVMPDASSMQSLEWMEYWFVKIVGAIYGVQPVMINAPTRGPGGYFQRMQIVVQNDRTREDQAMLEDAFNEQLVPKLGVYDWKFKFGEIEPRNELEESQIWQVKVAAGASAKAAGLNAELTDEGELKISGDFQEPTMPQGATHTLHSVPQAPKPPEPKQNIPFSTEKVKKGKSWIVTEVNRDSTSSEGNSEDTNS